MTWPWNHPIHPSLHAESTTALKSQSRQQMQDDFSQPWNWYIIIIVDFTMFYEGPVKAVRDIDINW